MPWSTVRGRPRRCWAARSAVTYWLLVRSTGANLPAVRGGTCAALVAALIAIVLPAAANAASPGSGSISATGAQKVTYSGQVTAGTALSGTSDDCFGSDGKP